ncbi:AmmeMemoRadiSam system protein A [Marinobacterium sediminicola]|uniref:Uncharacterized protein, PH0010 family/AmmeMemoRadiSam system protein A n=1 Tax=Marinobacterium sediminicola TaxID=518898 RepID=A0ABY1RVI8_9GAMM|nr:AmmeMemoRadiSam system protein A [Marinobacterium sediminicola]ULG70643.1 AmmeMemoRadiSam system protein A [Marinobacterium sediminicola]SMR68778.1 uncharacterized protein, PH0010 family/AmmeMemoRadiSam system protein A [Marinobacterium sediminicola]
MSVIEFSPEQQAAILSLARKGVCEAVEHGSVALPDINQFADFLRTSRACFVTLDSQGELRGCIGSLQATRPLAHDLLHNACGAALHDYRFPPLKTDEPIQVAVSILSPLVEMRFETEKDLLKQLVRDRDGVLLQAGRNRATFLPVVWEGLPVPELFLRALKRKAGLSPDYWSDQVKVWRYQSEYFSEEGEKPACE